MGRRELAHQVAAKFREHELTAFVGAISFRAVVGLVPLTILGVALLGALGLKEVWRDTLAPGVQPEVTRPVYRAIDYSVERLMGSASAGVIAFAALLTLWHLTWAVGTVMQALDKVHEVDDRRPWLRRTAISVGLAVATGVGLVAAALAVTAAPHLVEGASRGFLSAARWLVAIALVTAVVGLLIRFAPAERPQASWASAGSVLIVVVWIAASTAFRFWVTDVASFKSPVGTLTSLLVLTGYLFTTAAIFLVGAELDELLRQDAGGEPESVLALLRR